MEALPQSSGYFALVAMLGGAMLFTEVLTLAKMRCLTFFLVFACLLWRALEVYVSFSSLESSGILDVKRSRVQQTRACAYVSAFFFELEDRWHCLWSFSLGHPFLYLSASAGCPKLQGIIEIFCSSACLSCRRRRSWWHCFTCCCRIVFSTDSSS